MNSQITYFELPPQLISKNRIGYIDMLKTMAIFGVIVIHITSGALFKFNITSIDWYLSVFWATVVRWSVPIFFMCSGVLFLKSEKTVSIKQVYTKYLFRIVVALIFWALAYEMFDVFKIFYSSGIINSAIIKSAFKNIVTCNTHFHLYYLYIIVLIYALVPIIKTFTNVASRHQLEYSLTLWIFLGIVFPFAINFYPFNQLKGIVMQYPLKMAYSAIGYFVLGHYFHKYALTKRTTYLIYAAGIIGFFATLYGTIIVSNTSQRVNAMFLEGMYPNVAAMAAALFLLAKNLYRERNDRHTIIAKIIGYISKGSFCVYLVHDFFNIAFRILNIDTAIFSPVFSIPFLSLINLCLSLGVYFILSKIPVVNKYLV